MEDINKYYEGLGESYAIKLMDKAYMEGCTMRKLQCHQFIVDKLKRYFKRGCPFYDLMEYNKLEDILTQLNTYNNQNDIKLHKELATRERNIFTNLTKENVINTIKDFDLYYKDILANKENNSKVDRKEYKKNYMRGYMKTCPFETCECGSEVNIYKKTQHLNTLKHKNYIANI
jgi:activator of HSP90 ATPase